MNAIQLQKKLEKKVSDIRKLVKDNMPQKGNTEFECQKLTVLAQLNKLEYTINGISDEDMAA